MASCDSMQLEMLTTLLREKSSDNIQFTPNFALNSKNNVQLTLWESQMDL